VNVAFVTSVTPDDDDASKRRTFWRRALSRFGTLTTIVIDVDAGTVDHDLPNRSADELGDVVAIAPFELAHDTHPLRARRAPEYLGARWVHELDPFDLIVGASADLAPFCFGLASTGDIPVVLDLAAGSIAVGDEHARYQHLLAEVRRRCDLVVDTAIADGTITCAGFVDVERLLSPPIGPRRLPGAIATETAGGVVVEAPDRGLRHRLDPLSAIVYSLADGRTSAGDIVDVLAGAFSITTDVALRRFHLALDQLVTARLVTDDPEFELTTLSFSGRRFRVRHATIDHFVAHHVHSGSEYGIPKRLTPGTLAIDIGAHIGSFSARMIDSGADHVLALEPQPDNYRMATINLAAEIEHGLVDLRQAAIWSPPSGQPIAIGAAPTYAEPGRRVHVNTGGHSPRPIIADTQQLAAGEVVVASVSLDELITELRDGVAPDAPIWLKLDCEGGEWPALETAERLDQVDTIVGELHLDGESTPDRVRRIVDRLERFGFDVTITDDVDAPLLLGLRATRA
jgi:FkbM family methyltransferase